MNCINTCKDCRFWGYSKEEAIYRPEYTRRNCFVEPKKEMLELWPIGEYRNEIQDSVVMVTGPDFGCALFEPLNIKKMCRDLVSASNIPE